MDPLVDIVEKVESRRDLSSSDSLAGWLALDTWRVSELISIAIVLLVAGRLLALSWGKWLEPVIDSGRDLYIPEQIAAGHIKLYRDILYFYPPLTPYLLAGIVAIFGSSLRLYIMIALVISTITAATLYYIGRMTTGNLVGAITPLLLFVAWNFTGATAPGANWIFPSGYAATLAMLSFLLCLAALLKYALQGRGTSSLIMALVFGLLSCWTKLEYAAFVVAILTFSTMTKLIPWRALVAFAAAAGGSLFLVNSYFSDAPSGRHWLLENVLPLVRSSSGFFYSKVVGVARPENFVLIVRGAVLTITMIVALRLFDSVRRLEEWPRPRRLLALGVVVVVSLLISLGLGREHLFFRGWTLLQALLVPWILWRERNTPLMILTMFSLCASSRIAMRLEPEWYGFVFTLPLYLLIAYVLFRYLPDVGAYSLRASILWIPLIFLVAIDGIAFQSNVYGRERYPVDSTRGVFFDHNQGRAVALNGFLAWTSTHRASGLVVIPEGLTLNYLSGIPTPTQFQTFTPIEIANSVTEKRILEAFTETRPQLIVALTRDVTEFGYKGFGIDYARDIARYIREDYRPVRVWHDYPGFRLTILERREVAPTSSGPATRP